MSGQLFTQYYLTEGIKSTTRWHSAAANTDRHSATASFVIYDALDAHRNPNEAVTEQELIRPGVGAAGMDRLPAAAGHGPQRGHTRPCCSSPSADSKNRAAARQQSRMHRYARCARRSKRASDLDFPSTPATRTT